MKRSLLTATLGLTLLGTAQLMGCADSGDEECLPGDIDCADPSAGGKADGWNGANDPRMFASQLEYKLDKLPKKGKLATPVWKDRYPEAVGKAAVAWADTYWPTSEGSHNARWQGPTVKSPMEKYDAASSQEYSQVVLYLKTPPEISRERIEKRGRKHEFETYDSAFLSALHLSLEDLMSELATNGNRKLVIADTTRGDFYDTAHIQTLINQLVG